MTISRERSGEKRQSEVNDTTRKRALAGASARESLPPADAARVAATALVVHGDGDLLPTRLAFETAAMIPRAQATVIAGAGHMPFYEQPADFFTQVLDFLNAPDQGG